MILRVFTRFKKMSRSSADGERGINAVELNLPQLVDQKQTNLNGRRNFYGKEIANL